MEPKPRSDLPICGTSRSSQVEPAPVGQTQDTTRRGKPYTFINFGPWQGSSCKKFASLRGLQACLADHFHLVANRASVAERTG